MSLLLFPIRSAFAALFLCASAACFGQSVTLVTNSADYGQRVAPGSLASIFGDDLASSTAQALTFPLPSSLGGSTVEIGGALVPLLYASATQINFQVPSSLAAGTASLIVHAPDGDTSSFSFTVVATVPAIFQYGTNHAVAQNQGYVLNSDTARAPAGSVITVYLTGQGALDNPVADGAAAPSSPLSSVPSTVTATATVGLQNAAINFLGLTPGFAGLAQANIQVPTLPTGDYPLVITVGGIVSASALISVSGSGSAFVSPLLLTGVAPFANSDTSSIALLGNTAYICGDNNITMVDVSTPSAPTVIGEFGDTQLNGMGTTCAINTSVTNPYLVDIVGSLDLMNSPPTAMSFAVFDLTNPLSPVPLVVAATQYPYIQNISFFANFAFCSTSYFTYFVNNLDITSQTGDFIAFDFTSPSAPQEISVLATLADTSLKPAAAVIDQLYSYVASTTATGTSTIGNGMLYVINSSTPSEMMSQYQVEDTQAAIYLSFAVSGNTLLVLGNTYGNRNPGNPDFDFIGNLTFTTMDISNPGTPNPLESLDTGIPVNGTFYATAFTNGVFAIVNNPPITDDFGPTTLMIVDARTPTNPVGYNIQTQYGLSGILATTGGYLLASNSLGFYIYTLQAPW